MTKRVFIVHGWDGSPKKDWFPWLKKVIKAQPQRSEADLQLPITLKSVLEISN